MSVNVFTWSDRIDLRQLGLDLNNRSGRAGLERRFRQLLNRTPAPHQLSTPANLLQQIDLYGEQVTENAIADINKYLSNVSTRGFTIGRLQTGFSPLAITARDVKPSNTAVSVIGEGLVGWHMQHRGLQLFGRPIIRPVGEGPDLIFEDGNTAPTRTILVEVKSTQEPDVRAQMRSGVIPLLQFAQNAARATNALSSFVAGVIIKNTNDFDLLNLEIELY